MMVLFDELVDQIARMLEVVRDMETNTSYATKDYNRGYIDALEEVLRLAKELEMP